MMSNLSMVEAILPPGFRFYPRDEELICDYLMKKLTSSDCLNLMIEVDLNKCEPWDIPETACVGGKEWYFYSQRDRKYATGLRTNRATVSGYWKATGKDRPVSRKGALVGMRKTLVFYQGRAPKGRKTNWVMHEFRVEGPLSPPQLSSVKEDWVLCRVFHKNSDQTPAKQGMGSRHNDDTISSSSLPSLMDSYLTFDQTQPTNTTDDDQYEQVPCFSIFSPSQINPITFPSHTMNNNGGGIPELGSTCLNPFSNCDKNVLQAVLNHLTNMDSNPNMKGSFGSGEGTMSESFLSDVGFPTMWNQY